MSDDWHHPALLLYRGFARLGEPKNEDRVPAYVKRANLIWGDKAWADLLQSIHQRQEAQVAAYQKQNWEAGRFPARVDWRLAPGLSYGRLWEVGLQLHPLYGVPYLPASGIKGALRHWADESGQLQHWEVKSSAQPHQVEGVFGTEKGQSQIVLFDAFPAEGGRLLSADVVNKHHEGYYEEPKAKDIKPPTDYDTPSPVKFLTIARGVRFFIGYAIRPDPKAPLAKDVETLIQSCLRLAGLGAKTMKGYGRMTRT